MTYFNTDVTLTNKEFINLIKKMKKEYFNVQFESKVGVWGLWHRKTHYKSVQQCGLFSNSLQLKMWATVRSAPCIFSFFFFLQLFKLTNDILSGTSVNISRVQVFYQSGYKMIILTNPKAVAVKLAYAVNPRLCWVWWPKGNFQVVILISIDIGFCLRGNWLYQPE